MLKLKRDAPFEVKLLEAKTPWTTLNVWGWDWEESGIVTVSEGIIKVYICPFCWFLICVFLLIITLPPPASVLEEFQDTTTSP